MKKLALMIILAFALFLQNANAQYCQTIVSVSVSPSSIYAGDCITINGVVSSTQVCRPDPVVRLYLDENYIASVNTDSQNRFSYTYSTPSSLSSGTHTIKAVSKVDCCAEGYGTATFSVNPRCEAKYLDVWQCSGNWRQRQYQNSDCSLVWQNYEYCSYGCSNGYCLSPSCTPKYIDAWQCSGNWRQQLYQSSDCSTQWVNMEYCPYGCSNGYCITVRPCFISASVTTPNDVYLGDTIYTKVSFYNSGDIGGNINFAVYVCRADGTNCQAMSCDGFDPYVYIPAHSTRSFSCSKIANEPSLHKIKVEYDGCYRVDPAIYSSTFEVMTYACSAGYLNNFQCIGNWKQQLYQFSDCRTEWRNVLYCTYGCSAGQCLEAPKHGTPKIFVEPEYVVQKCEKNKIVFEISNTGEAKDSFEISFSGPAAKWVRAISSVSLDPGETRKITSYVSVPCDAEGEYELEISVANGAKDSAETMLVIAEHWPKFPTAWFVVSGILKIAYFVLILVIVIILILLVLFVLRLTRKRKEQPESFRSTNFSRKRPESFLEKECHHR